LKVGTIVACAIAIGIGLAVALHNSATEFPIGVVSSEATAVSLLFSKKQKEKSDRQRLLGVSSLSVPKNDKDYDSSSRDEDDDSFHRHDLASFAFTCLNVSVFDMATDQWPPPARALISQSSISFSH
jgi:hypothetical protein